MLYSERRRSFVASHIVLEKAGSHDHQGLHFGEEERTSNTSLELLEAHTINVRMRGQSRKEVERSFYTRRLAPAVAWEKSVEHFGTARCSHS